jgi:hypothetical protein
MSEREAHYQKFLHGGSIFLGALMGCLVTIPIISTELQSFGAPLLVGAALFGGLAGHRHRENRAFLYFCILGILVLSTLISFSMFQPMGN